MRFFISTILKFTTHFQTSSSSRIHLSKAMLRQYFVFSSNSRQRYFPLLVPGARARRALKAPLQKEQSFAGPHCRLFRALAKSSLQIWLLRGLEEVRGEVCSTCAAPPGCCKNKNTLNQYCQCRRAASHKALSNLNYNEIIH